MEGEDTTVDMMACAWTTVLCSQPSNVHYFYIMRRSLSFSGISGCCRHRSDNLRFLLFAVGPNKGAARIETAPVPISNGSTLGLLQTSGNHHLTKPQDM